MAGWTILSVTLRRLASAAALTLLAGVASATAADARRHEVKDPYFGTGLYQFFQERYFTSVTELMVSQHFGRVPHHIDEAELLRGGLLLSYGLHREAGEIFTRLIDSGTTPSVRDRAWYYLAKIRYQRGYMAEAEAAIGHIQNHLPADLEDDRRLLQANLLMARADYPGAASVLKDMAPKSDAAIYARYNLGIALIKSGEVARGTTLLEEVGQTPTASEEYRSLRDKANVALGYAALQDNAPERARTYLERVRLSGMLANKALLGFGWAEVAMKQPKEALIPWTELAQRDASDAAVLEAKLAVPYALAELGAYSHSLDQYEDAIAAFGHEDTSLDESIAVIRSGKLLDGLLASNPGEEMGWFWNIDRLPDLPHSAHLTQVLAQHEFQEAFKNYRDLLFLGRNLRQWSSNLGAFRDMLANRRQAFADRLPLVRTEQRALTVATLDQRRQGLAGELAGVETRMETSAFTDTKETDLRMRLDRVRATLDRQPGEAEFAVARERYRRVAGALHWQLAQAYPERLRDAKKAMVELDTGLSDAHRRDGALAQAQRDEPARFEKFAARIEDLDKRVQALTPRVDELAQLQRQFVQELAVDELQRQKERIAAYVTQANFALAQIYDRASRTKESTKESPKEATNDKEPARAPAP
jgi:hypothetical protein